MTTHPVCPRCEHYIPNDNTPGLYPGATSRTDNATEVCSACGSDEALEQWAKGRLTPQSDWPVEVDEAIYALNDGRWEEPEL